VAGIAAACRLGARFTRSRQPGQTEKTHLPG
jgi:hypothetical protein